MIKKIIAALFLWVLFGCASSVSAPPVTPAPEAPAPPPEEINIWNAVPGNDELVFLGIAGNRLNRAEAIRYALEDAARKVAVFYAVEGRISSNTNIGSGFFDYSSDTVTVLNYDQDYKHYVEDLVFDPEKDVFQRENAIVIRTRYRPPVSVRIGYQPAVFQSKNKPGWTVNTPDIPGYRVGVGYANPRLSHWNTVNAAYDNAIFSIIRGMSTTVVGSTTGFVGGGIFDVSAESWNYYTAHGVLKGFYVLDTWVDPVSLGVWTLAVSRAE
jgi:hypothetical protein